MKAEAILQDLNPRQRLPSLLPNQLERPINLQVQHRLGHSIQSLQEKSLFQREEPSNYFHHMKERFPRRHLKVR